MNNIGNASLAKDALNLIKNTSQVLLPLAANENLMSKSASILMGSGFANRYYSKINNELFCDFPDFVAMGKIEVDSLISRGEYLLANMLKGEASNLNPLSGIHAMLMTIIGLTKPGDIILSLDPAQNGHFATKGLIESIGRKNEYIKTDNDGSINLESLCSLMNNNSIKLLYLDLMSHVESVDIAPLKLIMKDAYIVYDASHTMGLIAGGQLKSPIEDGVDVICGNTHKTFPGPHRGVVVSRTKSVDEKIKSATDGKLFSSVHLNSLLALVMTIFEMDEFAYDYAQQIIDNSQTLSMQLQERGFHIIKSRDGSYTKNHQIHIYFRSREDAFSYLTKLVSNGITAHLCYIANKGFIVRLGVQEITRRGMKELEMIQVSEILLKCREGLNVNGLVSELMTNFTDAKYCFDDSLHLK